jgi:hypothetical protein
MSILRSIDLLQSQQKPLELALIGKPFEGLLEAFLQQMHGPSSLHFLL